MIYILPTDTCYGIACALSDKKNYEKIYKIKKRSLDKPIAIMVENFDWLRENTELTDEQVDFLKNYNKPFTILTQSSPVRLFLEFQDEHEEYFINKDVYTELSFRVANNDIEEDLIKAVGPIWLTSANPAGAGENYDFNTLERDFEYYIEKWIVETLAWYDLNSEVPASDVFWFIDDSLEIEYLRKN